MINIIDEQPGLYKIIEIKLFRETQVVQFNFFPINAISHVDAINRVLHEHHAVSPGSVGNVKQPWYMHTSQEDNLMVLHGQRDVDIYTKEHGKIEKFSIVLLAEKTVQLLLICLYVMKTLILKQISTFMISTLKQVNFM